MENADDVLVTFLNDLQQGILQQICEIDTSHFPLFSESGIWHPGPGCCGRFVKQRLLGAYGG